MTLRWTEEPTGEPTLADAMGGCVLAWVGIFALFGILAGIVIWGGK